MTVRLKTAVQRILLLCLSLIAATQLSADSKNVAPASPEAQRVLIKDFFFHSPSLGREMQYRLVFPREYVRGGRFPVLYLLHGLYGDYKNWDTRTQLETYAKNLRLLIVMPDADNSWYTNSASIPADKFEDYIAKDLISEIDGKYRTIQKRCGRAIAGLSMGGYAAVKLAVKYPQLFVFAGSLSGALNAARDLDKLRPEFRAKLLEVFGPENSPTREANDPFALLNKAHSTYPYFYLACGAADSFLETNRSFVRELSSRKIPYEYHETPGDHNWDYWDRSLRLLLENFASKLRH